MSLPAVGTMVISVRKANNVFPGSGESTAGLGQRAAELWAGSVEAALSAPARAQELQ